MLCFKGLNLCFPLAGITHYSIYFVEMAVLIYTCNMRSYICMYVRKQAPTYAFLMYATINCINYQQQIWWWSENPEARIIGVIRLPNNIYRWSDFRLSINKEARNWWTWINPAIAGSSLWYRRVFNDANFCPRLLITILLK